PGPHVPARRLLEPAGPPVYGLRVVGPLLASRRPDELPERDREPARGASLAAEPDGPRARLRLDRPDLPAAQAARPLALLRLHRLTAGLLGGRDDLRQGPAERENAGDLEPAALVHDGQAEQAAAEHRLDAVLLPRREARHAAGGLVGDPGPERERPSPGAADGRTGLRDEHPQRRHAQQGLELDGDLRG